MRASTTSGAHITRAQPRSARAWPIVHDHPRTHDLLRHGEVAAWLEGAGRSFRGLLGLVPDGSAWGVICQGIPRVPEATIELARLAEDLDHRFPTLLDEYRAAVVATVALAAPMPRHFEAVHHGQPKEGYVGDDGTFVSMVLDHDRVDGSHVVLTAHRERGGDPITRRRRMLRNHRSKPDRVYYSAPRWADEADG